MCTSIAFWDRGLFGRNLDLEYHFGEQVVITPRDHTFTFHHRAPLAHHHALIGMASVAQNTALYAEAANEKGLYMAGLYFPGNAHYFADPAPDVLNLAPYELIPLVLGSCATAAEARTLLAGVRLVAQPFAPGYPLAALHWQVAGPDGSFIMEPREDGLHFYDDTVGVLTNNPPYPYQRMNLNNYRGLSPRTPDNTFAPGLDLPVYGQGLGGLGLPGDASPMSRFVKAAFLRQNAVFPDERPAQVTQFFHLLDAVSMVRGSVITPEGRCDETTYACCIDTREGVYYYHTYDSGCLHAVRLTEETATGTALRCLPLADNPQFVFDTPQ